MTKKIRLQGRIFFISCSPMTLPNIAYSLKL